MLLILDLFGTFAFAISGAFRAVRYEMDILGVIALSIATGIGGGLIRDLLLGQTPPLALVNESYILICTLGALLVIVAAPKIAKRWDYVLAADAVGLAVFCAIGAAQADKLEAVPMTVVIMSVLTACGGGVIRDLLVNEIPSIFTHDLYASAALLGGLIYVLLDNFGINSEIQIVATISSALLIRTLALKYGLGLPSVRSLPASPSALTKRYRNDQRSKKDD
jgi:uncharacterized membrane protein YeiH